MSDPRVSRAAHLRSLGYTYQEIADRLGVSKSTARRLADHAIAARQRAFARAWKRRHTGVCVDCGGPTGYNGHRGVVSERCHPCDARARRKWTAELIVQAIRDWHDLHGAPPAVTDWSPAIARSKGMEERALRYEREQGRWPSSPLVQRAFGSWNQAIRAAGYTPRPVGRPKKETA